MKCRSCAWGPPIFKWTVTALDASTKPLVCFIMNCDMDRSVLKAYSKLISKTQQSKSCETPPCSKGNLLSLSECNISKGKEKAHYQTMFTFLMNAFYFNTSYYLYILIWSAYNGIPLFSDQYASHSTGNLHVPHDTMSHKAPVTQKTNKCTCYL